MALKVHYIKEVSSGGRSGLTQCGEPFHINPQLLGTGLVAEGQYEAGRRIGGLRACGEMRFSEFASQRYGNTCAKCRKFWASEYA